MQTKLMNFSDALRWVSGPMPPVMPSEPVHVRATIADGVTGTAQTIKLMQQLVTHGKREIQVRQKAAELIAHCEPKDYLCYAKAIYTWCRDGVKYVYDPYMVEYLERASRTLQTKIADCDSICILMASMLENIGLETQFVTIKADANRPDEFSHVYLRVNIPRKGWYVCDATMATKWFGWEPEFDIGKKYWAGSTDAQAPLDESPSVRVDSMGLSGPHHHGGHGGHRRHGGGWGGWYGPGYGWGYPEVIVVEGVVPTTDQLAIEAPPVEDPLLEGEKPGVGFYGIEGLGVTDSEKAQAETVVGKMLNGDYAREIRNANLELNRQNSQLNTVSAAVRAMPPGAKQDAALAALKTAREKIFAARDIVLQAQYKHEFIRGELDRVGVKVDKATLQGLGALGLAPAVIALLGTAAFVAACLALSMLINAFGNAIYGQDSGKGYIEQGAELVRSVGVVIKDTGEAAQNVSSAALKIAAVVGLGLLAWLAYDNKAAISGLFKARK